ncbi:MAG: hypothetical protein K0S34_790 [Bacillales bacterium]|jgi:hypothetical protein|nr:hypothetical protein [Bacillales bacterium]
MKNQESEKTELIDRLKIHVSQNLIHFQNVSRETLIILANMNSDDYLCFDTESCKRIDDETKERVWCWSLSSTINDTVIYGYTLTDFIDFMKGLYQHKQFNFDKKAKTKNYNIKIWVHNLGWDFEFLKYWLYDNNFKYYSKILYEDNTTEEEVLDCNSWNVTENNAQVYNSTINIKMNDLVWGKKRFKSFIKIKMYDSAKVVPDKLDNIGKDIIQIDEMFNKLKVPEKFYKTIRPYEHKLDELEKCYIYNDVYILKEFIIQYYKQNNLVGFTASGIAFNNMLNFMFPHASKKYEEFTLIYPEIKDKKIIGLIDDSYTGGFTYCNPSVKGRTIEKLGHSIDINSSYPSAMKYKKLPHGMPKYFKGKYVHDERYDIAFQKIHFDGFRRKNNSNIGFIKIGSCCDFLQDIKSKGYKKNDYVATNFDEDGQLLTCNYNLVLTTFELEMLLSVYDFYTYRTVKGEILKGSRNLIKKLDYIEGVKFLSKIGDFGEFIDDCVTRKNKYKEEENECGVTVAKRDMNSLYGKLGSGFTRTIMQYVKDDNGFFKIERKYENENEFDYEERRKYYRAFASFTTSYGRCQLLNVIINIEKTYCENEFLYCDTDSIYSTLTVEQLKAIGVELHKTKLGAWDIEKVFTKFKCLGAKKYILYGHKYNKNKADEINAHCAGLPYEAQKTLNFDNFYLGAVYKKKQKKKVIGGYRLENIEFTLKEFTFY